MQQICLPVEFYTVFYSEVPYGTAKEFSVSLLGKVLMVEAQKEAQILKMALKECSTRVKYCVQGGYWHLATPAEVGGTYGHLHCTA